MTDRQTDTHTHTQRRRETETERKGQADRLTQRQNRCTQKDRSADRRDYLARHTDRQADRQIDR